MCLVFLSGSIVCGLVWPDVFGYWCVGFFVRAFIRSSVCPCVFACVCAFACAFVCVCMLGSLFVCLFVPLFVMSFVWSLVGLPADLCVCVCLCVCCLLLGSCVYGSFVLLLFVAFFLSFGVAAGCCCWCWGRCDHLYNMYLLLRKVSLLVSVVRHRPIFR